MANTRSANTYYIDTQYSTSADELAIKNVRVLGVIVTPTAADAVVVLKDITSGATKLDLRVATDGESKFFDFSMCPILFPNGIRPTTLTNAVVTLIGAESRA